MYHLISNQIKTNVPWTKKPGNNKKFPKQRRAWFHPRVHDADDLAGGHAQSQHQLECLGV